MKKQIYFIGFSLLLSLGSCNLKNDKQNNDQPIQEQSSDQPIQEQSSDQSIHEQSHDQPILEIGKQYHFFDGSNNTFVCAECDPCWCIEFKDESSAKLWSKPCNGSSALKSCSSEVSYKFDENTNTVTILNVNNSNVSTECKNLFIGDWQWSNGKFGMRFYSKSHPGCDFSAL